MEMLKELSLELTREFMDNVDQLDGEEQHKPSFQLMFFRKIEEEFRQLK